MTQKEKLLKEIKKITRNSEIQEYLINNVPYEFLTDDEFVAQLIEANTNVKNVIDFAKITIAEEKSPFENAKDAKSYEERMEIDGENIDKIFDFMESGELLENKELLKEATKKYRNVIFDIAEKCKREEKYEDAQAYYKAILDNGQTGSEKFVKKYSKAGYEGMQEKDTLYYKANIGRLVCKSKTGELTDDEREELNNDLELLTSKQSSKEAFLSLLEEIPAEKVDIEILKQAAGYGYKTERKRKTRKKQSKTGDKEKTCDPELAPEKIIGFISKKYNIDRMYYGKCGLAGYILFDIGDKNVYIAEKSFKPGESGELIPNTGDATYIINKDADLDIDELNKGEIVAKKKDKNNKEVKSVNHRNVTYYDRLEERVELVSSFDISKEHEEEKNEFAETKDDTIDIKEQEQATNIDIQDQDKELEEYSKKLERMNELNEEFDKINAVLQDARDKQREIQELTLKVEEIRDEKNRNLANISDKKIREAIPQQLRMIKEANQKIQELNLVLEQMKVEELELKAQKNREEYQKLESEIRDF